MEERDTEKALRWIVDLLQTHGIPFQIAGGFAARLYGSSRKLADIDIGIPDNRFDDLFPNVKNYLTFGPAQYTDEEWDLKLMTFVYEGQEIDIAGEDTIKYFDRTKQVWVTGRCNFSKFEMKEIFEISIPIIPKESLIAHKKMIGREVDIQDVHELATIG